MKITQLTAINQAGGDAPPIACTISLTSVGGTPLDIDGQTASATDQPFTTGQGNEGIAQGPEIQFDWPDQELRILSYESTGLILGPTGINSKPNLVIADTIGQAAMFARIDRDNNEIFFAGVAGLGAPTLFVFPASVAGIGVPISIPANAEVVIGLYGNGVPALIINGVFEPLQYRDGSFNVIPETPLLTPLVQIYPVLTFEASGPTGQAGPPSTVSATVLTEGFSESYPSGVSDWCGNPLPEIPFVCTVDLVSAPYAGIGFGPADINGQTVSKTAVSGSTTFAGGVDPSFPRPVGSGVVVVEGQNYVVDTIGGSGQASLLILDVATGFGISVAVGANAGASFIDITGAGGVPDLGQRINLPAGTVLAAGVDQDTGDLKAWVDGVPITSGFLAPGGTGEGYLSAAAGFITLVAITPDGSSPTDLSVDIVTEPDNFVHTYGPGVDWCGDPLPE